MPESKKRNKYTYDNLEEILYKKKEKDNTMVSTSIKEQTFLS